MRGSERLQVFIQIDEVVIRRDDGIEEVLIARYFTVLRFEQRRFQNAVRYVHQIRSREDGILRVSIDVSLEEKDPSYQCCYNDKRYSEFGGEALTEVIH